MDYPYTRLSISHPPPPPTARKDREAAMDQHRPSIPNPGNSRFPPFFPPPNPHHNHHHHHLPPPPRLPPPPPPPHLPNQSPISLPPKPPPPPNSFHHHSGHSSHQFVDYPPPHRGRQQQPLDPNLIHHHRNHNHNLNNRPLDFQQAPRRVPERLVAVDRRRNRPFPTFFGHDPDPAGPAVWNPPPRVPIDATPPPPSITRRIPRACFDREHPPYRPTFQPVDRFRNDQDGGSRVRKDCSEIWFRVDELPRERRDGFSRNDNRFQRDVDCNIHRKEFVSSKVEHFSGSVTQKELVIQRRGDVVDGNLMWKNLPREAPHSPTEVRNRAIDGVSGFYEKGKNRALELERYGDRDRWDDAQDYDLTPRKKQKKNVLLRIQPAMPSFKNNYERSPSLCRDREPSQFPDHRFNKVRERSPIVSFKSNLLIVASSSPGAGADEVSAERDDKNWNELGNKDELLLPSNVVEKVSLKTDSDNHCENVPCILKKEEIHLEKNSEPPTNKKKLDLSPSHDLSDGNLPALSHKTQCLSEDKNACKSPNGKVLDKSYVASGSGKECSPSSRKKRKITSPCTSLSSSQALRKDLESMLFNEGLKDSGKDLTAAFKVTESTEIALTAPHMKSSDFGSTKAVDGKCADDSVSAVASISRSTRRKQRKRLLKHLSGKGDEIQVDVIGPTQDVQRTSNSDGVIDMAQKRSSSYMVRNDSSNMCLDVVSVPFQHGFAKRSSEAAPSSEGCTNIPSAPDSMNSSERQLNISRSGGADSTSRSLGVSDIVKEASQNQSSASLEEGEIEESVDANLLEKDNKSTKVSVPEEFHIREISDISHCNLAITLAADNVVPEDSGLSINGSDANAVNDALNMSCTGRISPSGVSKGFPESETLKGDLSLFPSESSLTKNVRKRNLSELHRGTGKNNAYNVTLGCSTDSYLAQDKVAGSGFTCPDAQLELRIGDCISTNGSGVKISSQEAKVSDNPCVNDYPSEVVTPTCNKKCKVLAPELGSAHGTPTEIGEKLAYSDVLPCDAEVPEHSIQAAPISSVDVGLSVSEFGSQSDLAHQRKGLDLNSFNDASAQISAGLKLVDETCGKGGSNFVLSGTANMSGIPDEKRTSSMLESVSLPQGDVTLLMTGAIDGYCGIGIESGSGRSIHDRNAVGDCSSQNQSIDHEPLVRDMKGDINIPGKGDLSSQSEHLTLFTQSTSDDRVTKSSMMDNLSLVDYPENLSAATSLEMFDVPNLNGNPDRKLCSAQRRSSGKSTMEASFLSSISNSTPNHIVNSKMASATDGIANSSGKTMPFIRASQSSKEGLQNSSNVRKKQTRIKNELNLASSKALFSHSSFLPSSGRRPTTVIKSRTWHRTDNPASNQVPRQNSSIRFVPQQKQIVSQTVGAQSNSYVRKGNSLLRNPATAVSQSPKTSAPATSVPQLNLSASEDAKNTPCEIPERLSSPCNIDSLNYNVAPVGDSSCSPVADSSMATENGPQGSPKDMPKSSGNSDFEMSKSLEDQGALNYSNQAASFTRRMVYIKHKSNQLVATSNSSSEISASNKDIPALTSDVYFKSKKNQLVRATSETHSRQTSADPVDEGRRVFKSYVGRSATRRDPNRVSQKIPKSRKFSLVWKLCNTRSPKKGANSLRCQQVLPHLLPWKRATYRRSLFRTSADLFKNSPLSHKFLSSRKTHIIYKRSGFSLRRSKVVSLAGSSLKWSISLEKRSKKVDKEANLAVAALEKEKREKSSVSVISSGIESKQNSLHEEHSRRRLRNDEYVRIGNGNQLIRNPKRRTRILANEKVRWSLHTARMRLAKKRKYCQFFTRFGKCNKGEGKCPYIHDPSKTAVCTKFLNGLCSDPKCKLTHKVIPERMPDCSFFLHGLCSNESCPYRHVSVNPKAAICESFLKGYCAEGNECRKKHSYMCPIYEATGECPEGSKCKLYHKKGKYNKRKNTKHQKNVRRRYFGSRLAKGNNEPETEGLRKRLELKDDGIILENGALADFISLDVSGDDEAEGEQEDEISTESNQSCWEEHLSIVSDDDPDELIKPIRLLRIMSQAAEGTA